MKNGDFWPLVIPTKIITRRIQRPEWSLGEWDEAGANSQHVVFRTSFHGESVEVSTAIRRIKTTINGKWWKFLDTFYDHNCLTHWFSKGKKWMLPPYLLKCYLTNLGYHPKNPTVESWFVRPPTITDQNKINPSIHIVFLIKNISTKLLKFRYCPRLSHWNTPALPIPSHYRTSWLKMVSLFWVIC